MHSSKKYNLTSILNSLVSHARQAKLFVTHMYSIDTHKSSVFANEMDVHFHITGPVCETMYLHNIFCFSPHLVPGAALRARFCGLQNHHAYASTIYHEMGKQRGGGSVPLLASFETRCVIRRPWTPLAAIKNSSQAGAKEFIFKQQK